MLWFSTNTGGVMTKADLYLRAGDTTIHSMKERLQTHPWVSPGSVWEDASKLTGQGKHGDHASLMNLHFHTIANCSMTMGFTKHLHGHKNTEVRTAWCAFGSGAGRADQMENRGLAINLLLNLCGFQGLEENGPGSDSIKLRWVPKSQPLARSDPPPPSGHLLPSESHMPPRPSRPTPSLGDVAPPLSELAEDAPPPLPQVGEG